MFDRPLDPFVSGRPISAHSLNRIEERSTRANNMQGGGDLALHQDVGSLIVDKKFGENFWIKITDGSNPYGWTEVVCVDQATYFTDTDMREAGTTTSLPAYEVEGITTVPIDSIVRAWIDPVNQRVWFKAPGLAAIYEDTPSTSQNDYDTGNYTQFNITPSANINITGFSGGVEGREIIVYNDSDTKFVKFPHDDSGSTAANRIYTPTLTTDVLPPKTFKKLQYNSDYWRPKCSTWANFIPRVFTPSASQNNYDLGFVPQGGAIIIDPTTPINITGIANGYDGLIFDIINRTANTITLPHLSGSSSAGNKIETSDGASITIPGYSQRKLQYDAAGNTGAGSFRPLLPAGATATVTTLTTKGDLLTYTSANARLPVGTTLGMILSVDSSTSTGLRWITSPASAVISSWKTDMRVATTAALPANTRTGNDLDANVNGTLPAQDGVTLIVNDRILAKDEATGANNGLYFVASVGSPGTKWKLTRTTDADTSAEVVSGIACAITEGTVNGNYIFTLTTDDPITLNTTALTFSQYTGSPLNTKGDVYTYSTKNTRLAIGANNTVFMADSTAATGNKWAATSIAAAGLTGLATWSAAITNLSGTLTATLSTQTANRVFAGPTSGSAATPTFRALVQGDMPVGGGTGGIIQDVLHAGTTDMECWYSAGVQTVVSPSAFNTTANKIVAVFCKELTRGTIDRMAIYAQSVSGTKKARVGIYAPKSSGNLYPGSLISSSGSDELTLSTGAVNTFLVSAANYNLAVTTTGGVWLAIAVDGVFQMNGWLASTCCGFPIGFASTLVSVSSRVFIEADHTFGAMPDPFPTASLSFALTTGPAIYFRMSA